MHAASTAPILRGADGAGRSEGSEGGDKAQTTSNVQGSERKCACPVNFCDRILSDEGVSPCAHFFKTRHQVRDSKSITDLRRYPLSPAASGLPLARGPSRPRTTSRVSLGGRRRIAHVPQRASHPAQPQIADASLAPTFPRIPRSKRTGAPEPAPSASARWRTTCPPPAAAVTFASPTR